MWSTYYEFRVICLIKNYFTLLYTVFQKRASLLWRCAHVVNSQEMLQTFYQSASCVIKRVLLNFSIWLSLRRVSVDRRVPLQARLPRWPVRASLWRRFLWWRMSSSLSLSSSSELRLRHWSVYKQLSARMDRRWLQPRYRHRRSQGVQWVHLHPPGRWKKFFQA